LLHWSSPLQVFCSCLDIEVDSLFAKIDHVAREEWLAMLLEVLLISIEKAIQPREEFLGTVVGVENDWNAIGRCNGSNIHCTSSTTGN